MDPATVGGFFVSAFLQVFFDRIATWEFLGYFGLGKLDKNQFMKMKTKFMLATLVFNDAEQQQITNPMVKRWLDDLQEVVYDTRDLMDRIDLMDSTDSKKLFNSVGLNGEMTEILIKLENIVKQKNHLGLKSGVQNTDLPRPQTTSLVEDSGVYGRDADKEEIMKSLLSNEMNGNKISVIPIVGMTGIGKTALAQLIYNEIDNKVMKKPFDFKAWICVTNEFNIFKITKTIAKRVGISLNFEDDNDLDFIQVELKKALISKKFLIVLDDVWVEKYSLWSEFMKPFSHGQYGSKIIVTTQIEKVASMVHDLPPYHLTTLPSDACWNLFKKVAFNSSNPVVPLELEGIGRKIVEKCHGLPLAVKSLGSLLRHQSNSKHWESIRDSDIWELSQKNGIILPALWLSYQYLPSHLKRCFVYCSIFPEGQFDKEDLIRLWMAEDLLQPQKLKRIEEVGEEYCNELLWRSLFQNPSGPDCFTMHDLVRDLANFIVGDFCFRLCDSTSNEHLNKPPRKIRYWSNKPHKDLKKAKHLRTLLLVELKEKDLDLAKFLPYLTCLRVLSLKGSTVSKLPNSIGGLKLLRYLNLSRTDIEKIPDEVCSLSNLQTLLLQYCAKLESWPINIHKLTNLRHLDFKGTGLELIPTNMGALKDLQTLSCLVLGRGNSGSTTIKELKDLQNLNGSLPILGLENVAIEDIAEAKSLENMKYITELEFKWGESSDNCPNDNHEKVLDGLQPHTKVKVLTIGQWKGEKFPKWVGDHSFCNLEQIQLLDCTKCNSLPPLGQLPLLKNLVIVAFDGQEIGDEFYHRDSAEDKPFRSLEHLKISGMEKCRRWSFRGRDFKDSFPVLKELVLEASEHVTGELCLPETIKTIEIRGCHNLDLKFPGSHQYTSLEKLHISESCGSIKSICLDYFPNLKELNLSCKNLESLVYSNQSCPPLPFLKCLKLNKCPKFESFPQGGLRAPILKEFHICSCEKLRSLSLPLSLQTLFILECPEVESFPKQGLPPNLEHLSICDCKKLFGGRMKWNLQGLTSLSRLSISKIDTQLDSFPEDSLLPNTLTDLSIMRFTKLQQLNGNALQHLTSLKYLTVSRCGELKFSPDIRLPDSVLTLDISGSKNLVDRLKENTGEDWCKVSHIVK